MGVFLPIRRPTEDMWQLWTSGYERRSGYSLWCQQGCFTGRHQGTENTGTKYNMLVENWLNRAHTYTKAEHFPSSHPHRHLPSTCASTFFQFNFNSIGNDSSKEIFWRTFSVTYLYLTVFLLPPKRHRLGTLFITLLLLVFPPYQKMLSSWLTKVAQCMAGKYNR